MKVIAMMILVLMFLFVPPLIIDGRGSFRDSFNQWMKTVKHGAIGVVIALAIALTFIGCIFIIVGDI